MLLLMCLVLLELLPVLLVWDAHPHGGHTQVCCQSMSERTFFVKHVLILLAQVPHRQDSRLRFLVNIRTHGARTQEAHPVHTVILASESQFVKRY